MLTQAKKAIAKNAHCWAESMRRSFQGLGTGCMGGRKDEKRVARYSPVLMPS